MPTIVSAAVVLWSALAGRALAAGQAGQAGAFLRQEPGARGAALGGAMTAIVDDASSLIWNPAGLARMEKPEIGATHVTLFEDTNYDFFSAGYSTRRFGSFSAAYVNQGSGGFQARQGPNDAPSSFSVDQNAFLGGWGVRLPGLPLEAGATVKLVHEIIQNTSASGMGVDLLDLDGLRGGRCPERQPIPHLPGHGDGAADRARRRRFFFAHGRHNQEPDAEHHLIIASSHTTRTGATAWRQTPSPPTRSPTRLSPRPRRSQASWTRR